MCTFTNFDTHLEPCRTARSVGKYHALEPTRRTLLELASSFARRAWTQSQTLHHRYPVRTFPRASTHAPGEWRMNSLSPVFSSDRLIEDDSVTFIVDTNVLVEFQSIERVDWSLLCPRAKSVRIVVPPTVIREMDKHKKGTGRLRRRAFEFNKLLQAIEDGDGQNMRLQSDRVELSLTLMERYARSELPEEKLSFEIPDDLIVAEAVKYSHEHIEAVFLADDNNARRTAREMGIRVARPVEKWRRIQPRDWRDVRIEELERQLGATPKLSLGLPEEEADAVVFETLREGDVPGEFCERLAQEILKKNQGIDRDELLRRHNLPNVQSRFDLRLNPLSVTVAQVDRYCDEYEQYRKKVIAWSRRLPKTMSDLAFAAPLQLEISNSGEAFAEDVEVTVRATKGYSFLTTDFIQSFLRMGIEAPEPPTGITELSNIPSIFEQHEVHRRKPFDFYLRNAPDRDGVVSDIAYECERFRHGSVVVLPTSLIKHGDAPSGGELVVRASSASLADPVEARYPIGIKQEEGSDDFRSHLRRRLLFFPEDVCDSVAQVLADF